MPGFHATLVGSFAFSDSANQTVSTLNKYGYLRKSDADDQTKKNSDQKHFWWKRSIGTDGGFKIKISLMVFKQNPRVVSHFLINISKKSLATPFTAHAAKRTAKAFFMRK